MTHEHSLNDFHFIFTCDLVILDNIEKMVEEQVKFLSDPNLLCYLLY